MSSWSIDPGLIAFFVATFFCLVSGDWAAARCCCCILCVLLFFFFQLNGMRRHCSRLHRNTINVNVAGPLGQNVWQVHDDNFIRIVPEGGMLIGVYFYINLRPFKEWVAHFPSTTAITTMCNYVYVGTDVVRITCLRYRTLTGIRRSLWSLGSFWDKYTINDGVADVEHDCCE